MRHKPPTRLRQTLRKAAARRRGPLEKLLPLVFVLLAAIAGGRACRRAPPPARLLLAAEAAAREGRASEAIALYDQVPADAGAEASGARRAAGDLWLDLGQASRAEREYRQALEISPTDAVAHEHLAELLSTEGRAFESLPHLYELLRGVNPSHEVLLLTLVGRHGKALEMPDELARWRAVAPADPAPLIGLARIELGRRNPVAAERLLREVVAKASHLIEAHALLGQILLESAGRHEEPSCNSALVAWLVKLPTKAAAHPDIWAVRGGWARRDGELPSAARCYWEALRRDANHQLATLQLAQVLKLLDKQPQAEELGRRAGVLAELEMTLNLLFERRGDASLVFRASRLVESLGRLWEARGWNEYALSQWPHAAWARDALARIEPQLRQTPPATLPRFDPAARLDLSHYPLPDEPRRAGGQRGLPRRERIAAPPRFADVAAQAGIHFVYFCGREEGQPRDRLFQSLGGGVAVLDFDLDGWPDLYFTQGCRWPPLNGQSEHLDALYRNLSRRHVGTTRFVDATKTSRLGDDRFSQGATVGDFDNDGFPDLYVANIGVNRLYRNNGDGTFSDVSGPAGVSDDRWTTSCLLADLNGDGLPDLYDVNYLQGRDVFQRACGTADLPRTCSPTQFAPAPDSLYLNLGDGRFQDLSEPAGVLATGGNGLGIVACDFSGSGKLNLFVANDQNANFYFVNETQTGAAPRFAERGLLSGLGYSGDGKTLASMGVAAADADGDGRIDLAVSNFLNESITLYLQEVPDSFTDSSGPAGLLRPSFAMLGFGAQFLDGELDGLPDLVVANGHVDEFASAGVSQAMRPQYFRNQGGGRFEELPGKVVGEHFARACFGRGLARLDFNRDGRDDFAVSALESPAALVSNQSAAAGHFLAIALRGIQSSRDAIGAIADVFVAGKRQQRQWLNAGDGFHASNERRLAFGLGDVARVDRLVVTWPSGLVQEFTDLVGDREILLIEGRDETYVLPH